jgi:cation transport regulator ChaB
VSTCFSVRCFVVMGYIVENPLTSCIRFSCALAAAASRANDNQHRHRAASHMTTASGVAHATRRHSTKPNDDAPRNSVRFFLPREGEAEQKYGGFGETGGDTDTEVGMESYIVIDGVTGSKKVVGYAEKYGEAQQAPESWNQEGGADKDYEEVHGHKVSTDGHKEAPRGTALERHAQGKGQAGARKYNNKETQVAKHKASMRGGTGMYLEVNFSTGTSKEVQGPKHSYNEAPAPQPKSPDIIDAPVSPRSQNNRSLPGSVVSVHEQR